jgi:aminopeptidase-like protein
VFHATCADTKERVALEGAQFTRVETSPLLVLVGAVVNPNMSAKPTARESIAELEQIFDRLWPLLRSITGEGLRTSLEILAEVVPLERIEVPSGTQVFDWSIPPEWRVRAAYVVAPNGERILDVADHTLHLLNYSTQFRGKLSRSELDEHLYSLPEQPQAIPYVRSYYEPRWGFCLPHEQRMALPDGDFEVVVDTEHFDGALSIGEVILPGDERDEVLLSTNLCHPSLANNELSGPLVAAYLYRRLAALPHRRYTYRFVFLPETIGSLAYLSLRGDHLRERVVAGYVITCVGLDTQCVYKRSRRGDSLADRVALHALAERGQPFTDLHFFPDDGSDERQYCSPGFDLPLGSLMRGMYASYPEYHTSLDNKALISFPALQETIDIYEQVLRVLEANRHYRRVLPQGEPNLGRRGLYPTLAIRYSNEPRSALLWLLNYADGKNDLLTIASRSGHSVEVLATAAAKACKAALVEPV